MEVELQQKIAENKSSMKQLLQEIALEDATANAQGQPNNTPSSLQQTPPPPTKEEFLQFLASPEGQQWQAEQNQNQPVEQGQELPATSTLQPMQDEGFDATAVEQESQAPSEGQV
jgi:ABC-type thiamine transport system substrate-binding protein